MITKASALIHGAAKVLGITGDITPEIVKQAYRRAAMRYHPDRNPAGLVMMKAVNAARAILADFVGTLDHNNKDGSSDNATRYGGDLNDAISHLLYCAGLELEICGAWLWVSGETRTHKDTIKAFCTDSDNKFRWHSKKLKWYFAPNDYNGPRRRFCNVSMDDIRERYGSETVATQQRTALAS